MKYKLNFLLLSILSSVFAEKQFSSRLVNTTEVEKKDRNTQTILAIPQNSFQINNMKTFLREITKKLNLKQKTKWKIEKLSQVLYILAEFKSEEGIHLFMPAINQSLAEITDIYIHMLHQSQTFVQNRITIALSKLQNELCHTRDLINTGPLLPQAEEIRQAFETLTECIRSKNFIWARIQSGIFSWKIISLTGISAIALISYKLRKNIEEVLRTINIRGQGLENKIEKLLEKLDPESLGHFTKLCAEIAQALEIHNQDHLRQEREINALPEEEQAEARKKLKEASEQKSKAVVNGINAISNTLNRLNNNEPFRVGAIAIGFDDPDNPRPIDTTPNPVIRVLDRLNKGEYLQVGPLKIGFADPNQPTDPNNEPSPIVVGVDRLNKGEKIGLNVQGEGSLAAWLGKAKAEIGWITPTPTPSSSSADIQEPNSERPSDGGSDGNPGGQKDSPKKTGRRWFSR